MADNLAPLSLGMSAEAAAARALQLDAQRRMAQEAVLKAAGQNLLQSSALAGGGLPNAVRQAMMQSTMQGRAPQYEVGGAEDAIAMFQTQLQEGQENLAMMERIAKSQEPGFGDYLMQFAPALLGMAAGPLGGMLGSLFTAGAAGGVVPPVASTAGMVPGLSVAPNPYDMIGLTSGYPY